MYVDNLLVRWHPQEETSTQKQVLKAILSKRDWYIKYRLSILAYS